MSENKCCKCGKPAEYVCVWNNQNEYYCEDCAINYFDGFDKVYLAKTCDYCGKPLPDEFYTDSDYGEFNCYCSIECAILYQGFEKIGKEK